MSPRTAVKACPVCDTPDAEWAEIFDRDSWRIKCDKCGEFSCSSEFLEDLPAAAKRDSSLKLRIERYLYETRGSGSRLLTSARGAHPDFQRVVSLESARSLYREPVDQSQLVPETLVRLSRVQRKFGDHLRWSLHWSAVPTIDREEADAVFQELVQEGHIRLVHAEGEERWFTITQAGLAAAKQTARDSREGTLVFVAASFCASLDDARKQIASVLEELGWSPYLVNEDPHNDVIDNRIREGIRRARFLVADLTENRQSVYYEVGFAHGLNKEVVLTCRRDSFNSSEDDFKRVHFDLNHRNIIVWEKEDELSAKLRVHVLGSLGRGGAGAS